MNTQGIYDRDGELFAFLEGARVLDLNGQFIGELQGNVIVDPDGERHWMLEGDALLDLRGNVIGYVGERAPDEPDW